MIRLNFNDTRKGYHVPQAGRYFFILYIVIKWISRSFNVLYIALSNTDGYDVGCCISGRKKVFNFLESGCWLAGSSVRPFVLHSIHPPYFFMYVAPVPVWMDNVDDEWIVFNKISKYNFWNKRHPNLADTHFHDQIMNQVLVFFSMKTFLTIKTWKIH